MKATPEPKAQESGDSKVQKQVKAFINNTTMMQKKTIKHLILKKMINMKKVLLLILLIYCQKSFSQLSMAEIEKTLTQPDWSFVIDWNSLTGNPSLPKFTLSINIADSVKTALKNVTKEQWQNLINNKATQWNANLFLYEVYRKSAFSFFVAKDREKWETTFKQSDLEYWSKM